MDFVNKPFVNFISNDLIIGPLDDDYDGDDFNHNAIPDATLGYIRFLIQPYFDAIKNTDSVESINSWLDQVFEGELLEYIREDLVDNTVDSVRRHIITRLIRGILEITGIGSNHNGKFYTPWNIKHALQTSVNIDPFFQDLGKIFGIEELPMNNSPTTFPVTVINNNRKNNPPKTVTVVIINNTFVHNITYQHVLGIIAFYNYINEPSPLFIFGFQVPEYINDVESMKNMDIYNTHMYAFNIGGDTYYFDDIEFFRGLLTAAQWLNVNPHDHINNLIERTYPDHPGSLKILARNQGIEPIPIPLNY